MLKNNKEMRDRNMEITLTTLIEIAVISVETLFFIIDLFILIHQQLPSKSI